MKKLVATLKIDNIKQNFCTIIKLIAEVLNKDSGDFFISAINRFNYVLLSLWT